MLITEGLKLVWTCVLCGREKVTAGYKGDTIMFPKGWKHYSGSVRGIYYPAGVHPTSRAVCSIEHLKALDTIERESAATAEEAGQQLARKVFAAEMKKHRLQFISAVDALAEVVVDDEAEDELPC